MIPKLSLNDPQIITKCSGNCPSFIPKNDFCFQVAFSVVIDHREYARTLSFERCRTTHYSTSQTDVGSSSYDHLRSLVARSLVARSLGRSVARWLGRSVARSRGRSVARSLGRAVARALDRSVARPLGRSVNRSLTRSFARSLDRSIDRSVTGRKSVAGKSTQ